MSQEHGRNNTKHKKPPGKKGSWIPILSLLALILIMIVGYHIIAKHKANVTEFFAALPR